MLKRLGFFVGLCLLFCPVTVFSQNKSTNATEKKDTKQKEVMGTGQTALEELVVSVSRSKEKKREVTSNITIIDEREIRISCADNLGDLLAQKGLGHIQQYPGGSTSIGQRGFRTETHGNDLMGHVLILIDGRRVGTGNAHKIMTRNVQRIEVIKGPASVQYGSAAMGGLINVITKQGRGKPSAYIYGKLGSHGHEEGGLGFSGKYKLIDFSGSVSRITREDYDTADDEHYHNTGFKGINRACANLGLQPAPGHRFGVVFTHYNNEKMGSPSYLSQNDLDDYTEKKNQSLDISYQGEGLDSLLSWKARLYFLKDRDKWYDPFASNPDFWDDGIASETKTTGQGAQAQISFLPENYMLSLGVDWLQYEVENTWQPMQTEYGNPAAFLLGKAKFLDKKLVLSGGLRYDSYAVEVKQDQGGDASEENFTPSLGVAFSPWEFLKLRANYAQGFRMPSAKELAADFVTWGTRYLGNSSLDPEKSQTFEAGADFYYKSVEASLTYFYTDFEDKIQQVATAGGDQTWKNLGEATISGIEGSLSYDFGTLFDWNWEIRPYFNFVYLTEYEDEAAQGEPDELLFVSESEMNGGLRISESEDYHLAMDLNFRYLGPQYVQDWEYRNGRVMEKGGFTVANLTLEKRLFGFEKYGSLCVRGEVRNLLNKDYEYVKGYPMPGRSFYIGLRYEY